MPRLREDKGNAFIPFGALDDDPRRSAVDHSFAGSKAPWHEIKDNLPQFQVLMPRLVCESDATNSVLCQLTRPLFNAIASSA